MARQFDVAVGPLSASEAQPSGEVDNNTQVNDVGPAISSRALEPSSASEKLPETDQMERPGKHDLDTKTPPFSIFTSRQKLFLVFMAGFAALYSPFTANIYFPAITVIADAFHKPVELINVTVTAYMVMQGVSPMLFGVLADKHGRRPIYMSCLLILCLTCIGLALVPVKDYWLLVLLRCIQAAGSAPTVAISAGTISDISTPAERGFYFGLFSIGPMVGPCLGPVLGGILSDFLGWRAIFWFLSIASAVYFVFTFLLMPETLRAQVGNGSIPAPAWNRPPISIIPRSTTDSDSGRPPPKRFINPGRMLLEPDVLLILAYNALINGTLYTALTITSNVFPIIYPFLNTTDVGLCFLALGGGMTFGSVAIGRILDWEYQRVKRSLAAGNEKDMEKTDAAQAAGENREDFPVEMARLRLVPLNLVVLIAALIGFGWILEKEASIVGAVLLLIIIGYTTIGCMNATQVLIMDLFPTQGSGITACNNLIRCTAGAGYVSFINVLTDAVGTGWACVIVGGALVVFMPALWVEIKMGPRWRAKRREREREREKKEVAGVS